jgi:AcrR family transcriptional regulator
MCAATALRDRRRAQTEREIQIATLRLALRDGYEAITTEMIAVEAGISLRTFFNYFPNKLTALVGRTPTIAREDADGFLHGSGPLTVDLDALLQKHLADQRISRDTTQMIDTLLARSPELVPHFHASLSELTVQITAMIRSRTGMCLQDAELMAELTVHALANGFRQWSHSPDMQRDDIVTGARAQVERVCGMMTKASAA